MSDFALLRLMPTVLRARDFRLYTEGGQRIVDLWQNGGAAILGHTPPSLLRALKNTAGRGLYAPFPHFWEGRYRAALSRLFPGRDFRLYAAPPPLLHTLVADQTAALWRPFLDNAAPPILIPVVPGIQGWREGLPLGLCVLAMQNGYEHASLPTGDFLPPVLLAVATRGLYDLIAAAQGDAPERANPVYRRVDQALKNSCWERRGVYLSLKQTPSGEEWEALFRRFLDNGFLLPPVPSHPLILPGVLSPGEEAQLAALLAIDRGSLL